MTSRKVAFHRLANQHIVGTTLEKPEETVRRLAAVQAQDYSGALWAVGLRTRGATAEDVEKAIRDRTIVRTWPLRGTLHFTAAADVRWMLELSRARTIAGSAHRHRQLGLDEEVFAGCRRLFAEALRGGKRLTRAEMYTLMKTAGFSPDGQRGIHILGRLALEGILCFGAPRGKEQTFVLLDEWLPPSKAQPREEALARLAERYFAAHGPATFQDFAWWSGLAAAEARAALHAVKPRLSRESVDGREYWQPRSAPPAGEEKGIARLLPPFDEYLVGYTDRSAAIDPAHVRKISSMLSPTILLGGRIVGTWRRTFKKDTVVVSASPFTAFSRAETKALDAAVRGYGEFLDKKAGLNLYAPPAT
jgi:hypothetical protein